MKRTKKTLTKQRLKNNKTSKDNKYRISQRSHVISWVKESSGVRDTMAMKAQPIACDAREGLCDVKKALQ